MQFATNKKTQITWPHELYEFFESLPFLPLCFLLIRIPKACNDIQPLLDKCRPMSTCRVFRIEDINHNIARISSKCSECRWLCGFCLMPVTTKHPDISIQY